MNHNVLIEQDFLPWRMARTHRGHTGDTQGRRGSEGADRVEVIQMILVTFLFAWLKRLEGGAVSIFQKYILTTNKGDSLSLTSHLPQPRIHLVQSIPVSCQMAVSYIVFKAVLWKHLGKSSPMKKIESLIPALLMQILLATFWGGGCVLCSSLGWLWRMTCLVSAGVTLGGGG